MKLNNLVDLVLVVGSDSSSGLELHPNSKTHPRFKKKGDCDEEEEQDDEDDDGNISLQLTDPEARENLLRMIASHSPMSWAHINMLGEYDSSDEKLKDSVGILPLKSAA